MPKPLDLDALSALVEAATPGPWVANAADFAARTWAVFRRGGTFVAPDAGAASDAAYIAAFSPDVARVLIAELRTLRAALTEERIEATLHTIDHPAVPACELPSGERYCHSLAVRLRAALLGEDAT